MIILLFIFRLSLWRELANLRLVFHYGRNTGHLREAYEILSMRQLFTVPDVPDQPSASRPSGRLFLALAMCVPLWQTFVTWRSIESLPTAIRLIGLVRSHVHFWVSVLLCVFVWWLSVSCLRRSREISKSWVGAYKELIEKRLSAGPGPSTLHVDSSGISGEDIHSSL